uniref:Uncharacterized protein n=1 Tax=Pararge aegeria TaxID=116150 RepID=S4NSK0_9NEOP
MFMGGQVPDQNRKIIIFFYQKQNYTQRYFHTEVMHHFFSLKLSLEDVLASFAIGQYTGKRILIITGESKRFRTYASLAYSLTIYISLNHSRPLFKLLREIDLLVLGNSPSDMR